MKYTRHIMGISRVMAFLVARASNGSAVLVKSSLRNSSVGNSSLSFIGNSLCSRRWVLREVTRAGSVDFEEAGGAHAAADAHGDHDVAGLAATALQQCVPDLAGAGHPVRVADGDGSAVDVQLVRVDLEEVAAVHGLGGEGLVQLPQVDVLDLEVVLGEKLRDGEDRSDPHLVRCAAGDRDAAVRPQWCKTAPGCFGRLHQDRGGGAVGQLGGVAGGDR